MKELALPIMLVGLLINLSIVIRMVLRRSPSARALLPPSRHSPAFCDFQSAGRHDRQLIPPVDHARRGSLRRNVTKQFVPVAADHIGRE
jgi:hypothetical protein